MSSRHIARGSTPTRSRAGCAAAPVRRAAHARAAAGARAASAWARCPRGKLPDATTTMVCGFCSTGCGLNVHLQGRRGRRTSRRRPTIPVNLGMACPKGWEALTRARRRRPRDDAAVRDDAAAGCEPVDWDAALRLFCERFKAIQQQHGPESVAFLSTGQIATEEMAFLGSLAKFGMGMLHGDGNTRQCMATSVVAYKQSFGFDAPPYTYARLRGVGRASCSSARTCASPIRSCGSACCRNPHQPRDHRRRSAQDRNGDGGDAAPGRSRPSRTWRCSTAWPTS